MSRDKALRSFQEDDSIISYFKSFDSKEINISFVHNNLPNSNYRFLPLFLVYEIVFLCSYYYF